MNKRKITLQSARESLKGLVKAKPNKANPKCQHFHDNGAPCCGVGYVLHDHGWTRQDEKTADTWTPSLSIGELQSSVIEITPSAMNYLKDFQSEADEDSEWDDKAKKRMTCTWGQAYKKAFGNRAARELGL